MQIVADEIRRDRMGALRNCKRLPVPLTLVTLRYDW